MADYEHISIEEDADEVFAKDSAPSLIAFGAIVILAAAVLISGAVGAYYLT